MKKIIIFTLLTLSASVVFAQSTNLPGFKELQARHYSKAEKKITKEYSDDPTSVANCYMLGLLYGERLNPHRNNEKAYLALLRSKELFGGLNNLKRGLLKRDGITLKIIDSTLNSITLQGLKDARTQNTKAAFVHFREFYTATMTDQLNHEVNEGISNIDYAVAERENSIESYEHFIAQNPESSKTEIAQRKVHSMAYAKAKSLNTLKAYERFVADYPDADEAEEAEQQVYSLAYYKALSQNTESAYRQYAHDFPESPYAQSAIRKASAMKFTNETDPTDWHSFRRYIENHPSETESIKEAKRIIVDISIDTKNADGLEWSLYKGDPSMYDTVIRALHDLYVNSDRIAEFDAIYGSFAPDDIKKKDREALDAILDVQTNNRTSVVRAINAIAPYRIAYDLLLYLIEYDAKRGKWDYARKTVADFEDVFAGNQEYAALKSTLSAPETKINRKPLESPINTPTGDEYSPVISADEQTIYFVGKNRTGNIGGEDIFVSTKNAAGQWKRPYPALGLNTIEHNESPSGLSRDGHTIVIFQNGKLKIANKDEFGWSTPKALPKHLQIGSWQSDAMLTADGRAMLFTARTRTEHEVAPSMNIYVSTLDSNGNWSEPISLGPKINTFGNDRAPFLHSDMKTLYFSSNRHSNIGGLDIFKCERLSDDSWTEWTEPVNLGKEINTTGDDCWFSVSVDGTKAYLSTNIDKSQDICSIDLPQSMRPGTVATLTGRVTDPYGKPLSVVLKWIDLETGNTCGTYTTDAENGLFYITLPLGKNYEYFIASKGYYPTSRDIDLRTTTLAKKEHAVLVTATMSQMTEGCSALPLNVVFNSSKNTLSTQSKYAIQRLSKIIKKVGHGVIITVYSEEGETAKTPSLDTQRAAAVKEELIKAGCKANLILVRTKKYEPGKALSARQHKHRSLMTAGF